MIVKLLTVFLIKAGQRWQCFIKMMMIGIRTAWEIIL